MGPPLTPHLRAHHCFSSSELFADVLALAVAPGSGLWGSPQAIDRHLIQGSEERFLRPPQLPAQTAGRTQRAGRIVLARHHVLAALKLPDDRTNRCRPPRRGEPQPATASRRASTSPISLSRATALAAWV